MTPPLALPRAAFSSSIDFTFSRFTAVTTSPSRSPWRKAGF